MIDRAADADYLVAEADYDNAWGDRKTAESALGTAKGIDHVLASLGSALPTSNKRRSVVCNVCPICSRNAVPVRWQDQAEHHAGAAARGQTAAAG